MIRLLKNTVIFILLTGCTANKYLAPGEKYFEGQEVEYDHNENLISKDLKASIMSGLGPDATRRFFLSRPGTWIYHQIDSVPKKKGLKNFIKNRLGTKPSLLRDVQVDRNRSIIESRMHAGGFFRAEVTSEIDTTRHRANVIYRIFPNQPYYFDSLNICSRPHPLCNEMRETHRENPVIKENNLFAKDKLEEERNSLTRHFRNNGYYFFASPLMFYQADSSRKERKVALRLDLHENLPPEAVTRFRVDSVTVNLASNSTHTEVIGDSLRAIIDPEQLYIRPEKLEPFIKLRPGDLYSREKENITLEHLNKLEIFEFVSLDFSVDTANGKNLLSANILTSPRPKHSLRSEMVLTTTSTGFTGPGLQLRYTNRNLFRGAEQLRISATGRYEQQLGGSRSGLTSYEIDLKAGLLVPRVTGLLQSRFLSGNIPKTKYEINYRLFNQPEYYAQSNFGISYGYEWLTDRHTFHDLRVINFDYVRLLQSSDRLEELFERGVLERESFEDQLIFGPAYNVTFRPQKRPGYANFFLGMSFELSGNILYGYHALADSDVNEIGQYEVLNVPFAQFAKAQFDSRIYLELGQYTELVLRQNAGIGLPYLNSSNLPFAKQFFVGGASSLRGYQIREVGPGTYSNEEEEDSFFDQTGDVLLEYNVETRFDLGGYLRSAVFLDAANVWLVNSTSNRPGGQFEWNDFYREFAVSAGVGLRIDADFIVVRFDLALPLRDPSLPDGDRWLFDRVGFGNTWFWDNLILNFAIGYPF
jgi:hypothetical protein